MRLSDVVLVDGSYYWVDTCYTFDMGWESMAFPCTSNGKVTDWGEVACARYNTQQEAAEGHEYMVKNLADMMYE